MQVHHWSASRAAASVTAVLPHAPQHPTHTLTSYTAQIQTGDPTGTGTGGDSIWGEPFEDEVGAPLVMCVV